MKPLIKKWVIRPLVIFLIAFAALIIVGTIVLLTEQQRLVDLAVLELNKQIKGELTISKSSISPFKHFPYISVALHDVKLYGDKTMATKPILGLSKIYVGFSLPDVILKKYNVRKLSLHGGYIEMIRDTAGVLNILAAEDFKSDAATAPDTTGFDVDLQKVALKDLDISYLDKATGMKYSTRIASLASSFKLKNEKMLVDVASDMILDLTSPGDTTFFRHKKLKLAIKADYNLNKRFLELGSGDIKLQEAEFKISGTASVADTSSFLNFHIEGDKPDLSLITAFLPGDVKSKLKPFKYDGDIYFDGVIKGSLSKGQLPLIEVVFGCRNAWFLNTGADKKIDLLGFSGRYTNGSEHSLRTSELHITNVTARPEKGTFKGNFVLQNFIHPRTLIQLNSELELKFIGDFFAIRDLQQITGKIKLDMDFKDLDGITLPEQSLNKLQEGIQSRLLVEDLSFKIPGYPYVIRDLNLLAQMKNGRVSMDSASFHIGDSDMRLTGSISDVGGFLRDREKLITLTLNASSKRIILRDIFASDTSRSRRMNEEIHNFNIGLAFETSFNQLLQPDPVPKGKFEVRNLRASFKRYPHTFRDLGATITVNDTALLVRNFAGMVDKSDFNFSGRVINYHLWFKKIMKGKTQIAFDFKSNRFAIADFLGPMSRKYIPAGYRKEEASNVWLRSKIDLRYDTIFRFAKAHIANISGELKNHRLKVKDIQGNIKYGANHVIVLDTLKGTIGKSDFDITLHLFAGADKKMKKRTNYLQFHSRMLDLDELTSLNLTDVDTSRAARTKADSSAHAKAFNIFSIPFIDFKADVEVAKIKYEHLWLKDVTARLRMQEDHLIFLDTIGMKVADGTVGVKGNLNGTDPSHIFLKSTMNINQIDLEKMLLKFDHLGEDVVINKNLKGHLSGQIVSEVLVHPDLVPQVDKTKADLDVVIYNGSLNNFAPMQAMASFFKDKNLKMVRFDTLQNKLSFANGVLHIPNMSINSSLGYIEMSGNQSMDLTMEYYIRVPMKMVTKVGFAALFDHKADKVDANQVDEIDYAEKQKKMRFMNLKVTGKPDDYKVGLGKDK